MAQDIELLNAQYSDVPGVLLPKTGGGTALFTDVTETTATQGDVRNGLVFFNSSGNKVTGNALNVIQGTFTTPSTSGVKTLSLPYDGNGYPIEAFICINNGMYNNTSGGDANWYNLIQRYAIGMWLMSKAQWNTTPTYGTTGDENGCTVMVRYKNSTSSALTYAAYSLSNAVILTSTNANASNTGTTAARFKNAKTLSYYVASNSYGFLADTTYDYMIRYSE